MFTHHALQPHGLDLYAPGALAALFALRRETFGDALMEGENEGENKNDQGQGNEAGFPDNTSVKDMKPEEQAAYWKNMSRRNEDRVKAYGDLTPEQAIQLKKDIQDAKSNSLSEQERAVEAAKEEGRAEVRSVLGSERARSAFEKALSGRTVEPGAMLGLNLADFIDGDKAKADEIKTWVDTNSSAVQQEKKRFPPLGQGDRERSNLTDRDAGQSEADRRFGKKT